jgi:apolipoprotein N-acyltransferase
VNARPGQALRVPLSLAQARAGDATLALALGALHSLPFVHTWGWALQLACVAWLAWRVQAVSPARAALLGGLFAWAWLAAGIWWLFVSMHYYGGLPVALAVFAVVALCAFLALFLALAMALHAHWRSGRPALDALLFAALWLAAELARGVLLTGFPWLASGYAHVDSPLAALAPWVGVYGIGMAAALVAALAAAAWRQRRAAPALVVAAGLGALAVAGPVDFSRPAGALTVTLVQTNVAQDEKADPAYIPAALAWMRSAFLEARGQLVVGPETAIPLLPAQIDALDPGYWASLREAFAVPGRALLVGTPLGDAERGYTNSVIGLSAAGIYRYDKAHLVPFGEFVPPGFGWFVELWALPLGDFTAGPLDAASFDFAGQRIAPNICYEDLFGEELARRFRDAAKAPTVFVNLSNIAWFGDTVAVPQHLHISRLRALEFQRPMLRATNTGATVAIDHRGQVTHSLPPFTRGVLEVRAEGREGLTPYARWAGGFGLWPPALLAAALAAAFALAARRRRRSPLAAGS